MRRLASVLSVVSAAVLMAGCSSPQSDSSSSIAAAPTTAASSAATSAPSSPSVPSSSASPKRPTEPLPDPAAILKDSGVTTADLHSVHLSLAVTGDIEDLSVTALEADVTAQPDPAAKGYAKIAYRDGAEYVRFVVFGGRFYVSRDRGRWIDHGAAANLYDAAAILSPETGLAELLTDFVDPSVDGRETIDLGGEAVHTVRISGEVSAAAARKVVPQLQATKRTACTVWIEESGAHRLVALELASGADDAVRLTFSNWNAPVVVGKPQL
ncbi:LppX_LprAFG lipoprotein [Mycolicibacter minnesotensis]